MGDDESTGFEGRKTGGEVQIMDNGGLTPLVRFSGPGGLYDPL